MGIVFAVRGTSFDARYSNGGKTGINPNGGMTVTVDATSLSGSVFLAASNNTAKPIIWSGRNNTPNGRAFSMLLRLKPGYTGSPAAGRPMSFFLGSNGGRIGRFDLTHNTSGNVVCTCTNEAGTTAINAASFGAWSPTSTTWYDIVFTWDGTTTANSAKVYIDATLLGSVTPAAALTSSWTTNYWTDLCLSNGSPSLNFNAGSIDEAVIWDSVITPTNVTLVSGAGGSLNGASRTSLVDVVSLDGAAYTDPGVANVRLSTGYTYAGSSLTGTAAIPTAANVRSGTATDATTGTLAVPTAANVRSGVSVDATTGTLVVPTLANTKTGVAGDGGTGTYDGSDRWTDPGDNNVRLSTAYKANSTSNNKTGRVTVPTAGNVKTGVTFETDAGTTGTYDGSDRWTDPGIANTRSGTNYKANSTVNNRTGTLNLPSEDDVRSGTTFDGATKTGLLDLPAESDVKDGVVYDNTTKTGTYAISAVTPAELDTAKDEIIAAVKLVRNLVI